MPTTNLSNFGGNQATESRDIYISVKLSFLKFFRDLENEIEITKI